MNAAARSFLGLFLPKGRCLACSRDSSSGPIAGICRNCWKERRRIEGSSCPSCGTPLPPSQEESSHLCGICLADPPCFEGHVSVYAYKGPVRLMVLLYKDKRRYPLARLMGAAGARAARKRWPEAKWDAVVAVPSPLKRRLARGFEPAALMASEVARRLGAPLFAGLALRRTPAPQKELTVKGRRANVQGAFMAKPERVRGKRILLVDDVMTTGATLREAARVLKRAGAEVHAVTFAMTLKRDLDLYAAPKVEGAELGDAAKGQIK